MLPVSHPAKDYRLTHDRGRKQIVFMEINHSTKCGILKCKQICGKVWKEEYNRPEESFHVLETSAFLGY